VVVEEGSGKEKATVELTVEATSAAESVPVEGASVVEASLVEGVGEAVVEETAHDAS
jgi:hypothetical protein